MHRTDHTTAAGGVPAGAPEAGAPGADLPAPTDVVTSADGVVAGATRHPEADPAGALGTESLTDDPLAAGVPADDPRAREWEEAALVRQVRRAAAAVDRQMFALVSGLRRMLERGHTPEGWLGIQSWLSSLGLAGWQAKRLAALASLLRHLPCTYALWADGVVGWPHIETIFHRTKGLEPDELSVIDRQLSATAHRWADADADWVADQIDRLVARLDHHRAVGRVAYRVRRRALVMAPFLDGSGGSLHGVLDPVGFAAVGQALDAAAGTPEGLLPGDDGYERRHNRFLWAHARADALVSLLSATLPEDTIVRLQQLAQQQQDTGLPGQAAGLTVAQAHALLDGDTPTHPTDHTGGGNAAAGGGSGAGGERGPAAEPDTAAGSSATPTGHQVVTTTDTADTTPPTDSTAATTDPAGGPADGTSATSDPTSTRPADPDRRPAGGIVGRIPTVDEMVTAWRRVGRAPLLVVTCTDDDLDGGRLRLHTSLGTLPIPAGALHRTLHEVGADVRAVLTDPLARPVRLGSRRRLAPPALRQALLAIYRRCVVPGCTRSAARCDLHHLHPAHQAGPTHLHNLVPLCRTHHTHTTDGRLRITRTPQGILRIWPEGRPDRAVELPSDLATLRIYTTLKDGWEIPPPPPEPPPHPTLDLGYPDPPDLAGGGSVPPPEAQTDSGPGGQPTTADPAADRGPP